MYCIAVHDRFGVCEVRAGVAQAKQQQWHHTAIHLSERAVAACICIVHQISNIECS
jgi:hypothetical protein